MTNRKVKSIDITEVDFGKNVTIVKPVNLYGCIIKDNAFIGPFVEIQKNAIIGERTKIQSHSFVCELVEIGKDCFIGHGVMFINDIFMDSRVAGGDKSLWKSTIISDRVLIGSNSTILPVEICSDVVIGAGTLVNKNITSPGTYIGNPMRRLKNKEDYEC